MSCLLSGVWSGVRCLVWCLVQVSGLVLCLVWCQVSGLVWCHVSDLVSGQVSGLVSGLVSGIWPGFRRLVWGLVWCQVSGLVSGEVSGLVSGEASGLVSGVLSFSVLSCLVLSNGAKEFISDYCETKMFKVLLYSTKDCLKLKLKTSRFLQRSSDLNLLLRLQ